jgi:hypothetical protein
LPKPRHPAQIPTLYTEKFPKALAPECTQGIADFLTSLLNGITSAATVNPQKNPEFSVCPGPDPGYPPPRHGTPQSLIPMGDILTLATARQPQVGFNPGPNGEPFGGEALLNAVLAPLYGDSWEKCKVWPAPRLANDLRGFYVGTPLAERPMPRHWRRG